MVLPCCSANGFSFEKSKKESSKSKKETKDDLTFIEEGGEDETEKIGFPILFMDSHKWYSKDENWLVPNQTSKQNFCYSLAPRSTSIIIWIQNFRI